MFHQEISIYRAKKGSAGETLPQEQKQWNPHYSTPCPKVWFSLPAPKKLQCLGPAHVESTGDATKRPPSWERRRGNASLAESIYEETDRRRRETL